MYLMKGDIFIYVYLPIVKYLNNDFFLKMVFQKGVKLAVFFIELPF